MSETPQDQVFISPPHGPAHGPQGGRVYPPPHVHRAIGPMTKHSIWAADGIAAIARDAKSGSVRLRAFRTIFSDMMAVATYTVLDGRVVAIEQKLGEQAR